MNRIRAVLVALTLAILVPILAEAQSRPPTPPADMLAAPNHPGWSVDARTGCWVWNSNPESNETVTWSGGCGADGRATGRGIMEWRFGEEVDRYEGELRDGRMNGHGVYVLSNGDRYDGEWRDDNINGHGVYTWANGSRYDGEWRDGRPDGYGEEWLNGETYRGTWVDGCFRDGNRRAWIHRTQADCQ